MSKITTMHAVQYNGYGGGAAALKHVEVPVPTANKDEVLLKLEAASINPFDWKVQKGMLRLIMPLKFPFTPVLDVAGEVVAVGPGVDSFKEGDKVVSMLSPSNGGGLAEYAVASVNLTVIRPPGISPAEGAGLPVAALTALQALRSVGARFGSTTPSEAPANILITAASGGVGLYTVQLAKLARSHVTATCGARNVGLLRSLGADEVLDYRTPEGSALKSPSGRKYGAAIHCASGIPWSAFEPNLSANGKVVDINPSVKAFFTSIVQKVTFSKKRMAPLLLSPKLDELKFVVELMDRGELKTVVDSKYPLEKAEEAWAKSMEGHATGKIIVEM